MQSALKSRVRKKAERVKNQKNRLYNTSLDPVSSDFLWTRIFTAKTAQLKEWIYYYKFTSMDHFFLFFVVHTSKFVFKKYQIYNYGPQFWVHASKLVFKNY